MVVYAAQIWAITLAFKIEFFSFTTLLFKKTQPFIFT